MNSSEPSGPSVMSWCSPISGVPRSPLVPPEHDAGVSQSGTRTVRWTLSLIRGKREARSLIARSPDSATARFIMKLDVQLVHRAVSFIDHLVDRASRVKPQQV